MPYTIEEISNIKAALKHISYDTWVVLDLDHTVMASSLDVGGDSWFEHTLIQAKQIQSDPKVAADMVVGIYNAIQSHLRTKAVEPTISMIIKALQQIGVPILALTARGPLIKGATIRQLHAIGIDFSKKRTGSRAELPTYFQGIIFCDGKGKGEALDSFLKTCDNQPRHILMLDDKGHHLEHVNRAVKKLNIERYSGLRYGFFDEQARQFNRETASHQLAYLKERLPPDIQVAIDELQLLPYDPNLSATASNYSHGFFDLTNLAGKANSSMRSEYTIESSHLGTLG